jgi:GxxExxY protein
MYTKQTFKELTYSILSVAIEVHKHLGPGLLESVYHNCMKHEFYLRGIYAVSEFNVPVIYKGLSVSTDLRCDFLVENLMVVDLKSTFGIAPIHEAIMHTYMRLLEKPKGIIINFNCTNIFKEGQQTVVNELFRALPEK